MQHHTVLHTDAALSLKCSPLPFTKIHWSSRCLGQNSGKFRTFNTTLTDAVNQRNFVMTPGFTLGPEAELVEAQFQENIYGTISAKALDSLRRKRQMGKVTPAAPRMYNQAAEGKLSNKGMKKPRSRKRFLEDSGINIEGPESGSKSQEERKHIHEAHVELVSAEY